MLQFTAYHNSDCFDSLEDYIKMVKDHGLNPVEQSYSDEWDETTIIIHGSKDQFESFFLKTTEGDWGTNIDEFMDELKEV